MLNDNYKNPFAYPPTCIDDVNPSGTLINLRRFFLIAGAEAVSTDASASSICFGRSRIDAKAFGPNSYNPNLTFAAGNARPDVQP